MTYISTLIYGPLLVDHVVRQIKGSVAEIRAGAPKSSQVNIAAYIVQQLTAQCCKNEVSSDIALALALASFAWKLGNQGC